MKTRENPIGFKEMVDFGLIEALLGRRSRRFFMGAEMPDGVFAYKSRHKPAPLTDLEKMLVVALAALVFGKFCLGSYVFRLLRGEAAFAKRTLPWVRSDRGIG